ncbi:MAG: hypothetical protein LBG60_13845 [Bifidobacteriaceae bacterium]|jgi:hypothetical protein|nr:hypothetical protein [Bifidobacteriaceae bacterium]
MFRTDTATDAELAARRDELVARLPGCAAHTPGSLHRNYRRCGKPNCRCAQDGDPGHGPRHVLVRYEAGKPRTVQVPAEMAPEVADGVAAYREFNDLVAEIAAVNSELSDRKLRRAASPKAAARGKKGGSAAGGAAPARPPAPFGRRSPGI